MCTFLSELVVFQLYDLLVGDHVEELPEEAGVLQIVVVAETDDFLFIVYAKSYLEVVEPSKMVKSLELS